MPSVCLPQLYARFQFKCVEAEVLGDDGVCVTALVRQPFRVLRARSSSSSGGGGGGGGSISGASGAGKPAAGAAGQAPARPPPPPRRQPSVPSSVPAFFSYAPPATAAAQDVSRWRAEVVARWREVGASRTSGSALAAVVARQVAELEDLQRKLFGSASSAKK